MSGETGPVAGVNAVAFWAGPEREAVGRLDEAGDALLFAVGYGITPSNGGFPCPLFEVPNPVLGEEPWLELWRADGPARRGRCGRFDYAVAGDLLAAGCRWPLTGGVEEETRALYRELLALADETGRPGLLRLWNYLPGINDEERSLERYRLFNAGRAGAFADRFGPGAERRFCASSAVGTPGDALLTALLASRESGRHLENPRQLPAWRYPLDYGPVSPSFARATVAPAALGGTVLVSGTASIVGHESRHHDDLASQIEETLANLEAVLERARAERASDTREEAGPAGLSALDFLKVYLRRPADLPAARSALARRIPSSVPVLYLQADICRAELLIEIEGIAF